MNMLIVAVGGFIGSIARYYVYKKTKESVIGTLIANVTGSIIFAIAYVLFSANCLTEGLWIFLTIGFSGSYTTFSTFGNETLHFILRKEYAKAIGYMLGTIVISFALIIVVFKLIV